jgi:hypothetical protein
MTHYKCGFESHIRLNLAADAISFLLFIHEGFLGQRRLSDLEMMLHGLSVGISLAKDTYDPLTSGTSDFNRWLKGSAHAFEYPAGSKDEFCAIVKKERHASRQALVVQEWRNSIEQGKTFALRTSKIHIEAKF